MKRFLLKLPGSAGMHEPLVRLEGIFGYHSVLDPRQPDFKPRGVCQKVQVYSHGVHCPPRLAYVGVLALDPQGVVSFIKGLVVVVVG